MKRSMILAITIASLQFAGQNLNYGKYYILIARMDDYLYTKSDYINAASTSDSILKFDGLTDHNLNAALVNYNLKRYSPAYLHFLKYAQSGNSLSSIVNTLEDSSIFKFRKSDLEAMLKKYPDLDRNYNAIRQTARLKFDVQFNNDLIRLLYKDQSMREVCDVLRDKIDSCCLVKTEALLNAEFIKSDSLVFLELKSLIQKNGLPPRNEISNEAFFSFYIILLHGYTNRFSHDYCDSILTIAKQKLNTGIFLTPGEYASVIDRYYINIYEKNYYCELNDPGLPITDSIHLNNRRREIFLPDIGLPK